MKGSPFLSNETGTMVRVQWNIAHLFVPFNRVVYYCCFTEDSEARSYINMMNCVEPFTRYLWRGDIKEVQDMA